MSEQVSPLESLLHASFAGRVQRNEPLAAHSSAGVGGPADFFLDLQSTAECEHLIRLCAQFRTPVLIIGHGSNILFLDQGVRGIVARMGAKTTYLEKLAGKRATAVVDAGLTWSELIEGVAQQGWGGLDFGREIPGTVGGAIVTNAGFHNDTIGQYVQWVEVLDARGCNAEEEGEWAVPQVRRYTQADLQLGNRQSRFREQRRAHITASGQLVSAPRPLIAPPEIILRLGVHVQRSNGQHPVRRQSDKGGGLTWQVDAFTGHVGPLFRDPVGGKASQIIAQGGMDAWQRGAVQVSTHNANFLVNRGGAQAADIARVMVAIHQHVLTQTGVDLEVDLEVYGV